MEVTKFCPHCASENFSDAPFCANCSHPFTDGQFQHPPRQAPPSYQNYPRNQIVTTQPGMIQVPAGSHPVWLVAVLSILFGGWIGMLINRQISKGLIYGLVGTIVISLVTCGLGAIIIYPLTIIDAILVANKLNRGEPVKEWQFF